MPGDWIKIHRQLKQHPLWLEEPFTRGQAWVDMLMMANWAPGFIRVRGVRVDLKRGQLPASFRFLAGRWRWSTGKVERFLSELETMTQIETQKGNVTQVLTIVNYERYQSDEYTDEDTSRDTNEAQTGRRRDEHKNKQEQPTRNNGGEKTENLGRYQFPEVSEALSRWRRYYSRKFIGDVFTDMELEGRLMTASREGWSPKELVSSIEKSIESGWRKWVRPSDLSQNVARQPNSTGGERPVAPMPSIAEVKAKQFRQPQ